MKNQRILIGAAVGATLAGVGLLLFHSSGKKLRKNVADFGVNAADKIIHFIRTNKAEHQGNTDKSQVHSRASAATGSM